MKRVLLVVLLGFVIISQSAMAATNTQELETRVEELEKQNAEMNARYLQLEENMHKLQNESTVGQEQSLDLENQMQSFMKISGYADVEFRYNSKANQQPGFRLHHFSLFFTKNISEKWRLFSEIEYEDAPVFAAKGESVGGFALFDSFDGKIFLEAMNIDYLMMREVNFRVGRFYTPAGIWSVDHYPPFVPTQVLPEHISKIFPQLVDGGLIYGSLQMGETFLKYDTYIGNGEGNPGSGDNNSEKALGVKLGLLFPVLKHFEIGSSYYVDTLNNSVDKSVYGAHAKLHFWSLIWQSEYAKGTYEGIDNNDKNVVNYNDEGYYSQIMYSIGKFGLGYRYDFYDDNIGMVNGENEKTTNSVFFNYRIVKDIVIKFEYHNVNTFKKSDKFVYDEAIVSIVANLGN